MGDMIFARALGFRARRGARRAVVGYVRAACCLCGLVLTLAGCSGTPAPPLANRAVVESNPALMDSVRSEQRSDEAGDGVVRQLRAASIVLYRTESGHEGQRVAASSLPLPLRTDRRSADGSRFEIITVDGPRWIAFADVARDRSSARSNQR